MKAKKHFRVRTPKVGRDMCYGEQNALLYVCGSDKEIYRLHLEQGRFFTPLEAPGSSAVNVCGINPVHSLLGFGSVEGVLHFFDSRSPKRISSLDLNQSFHSTSHKQVTAFRFHDDGLTFGAGMESGECGIFDLRMEKPTLVYDHKYGFAVNSIRFHSDEHVVTTDKKVVKIWNHKTGKIFTNIECPSNINDTCLIPKNLSSIPLKLNQVLHSNESRAVRESEEKGGENSGLLLVASESSDCLAYFVPALGPAPRWCTYLDNITEELQKDVSSSSQFDDYKFVTREELEKLSLSDVVGTNLVKPYMHGFFISIKLYNKMKAVSDPFAWENYRKQRIREKIEEGRASRLSLVQKKTGVSVNKELSEVLKEEADDNSKKSWMDPRFASSLFSNTDFQIDTNSADFLRVERGKMIKEIVKKKEKISQAKSEINSEEKMSQGKNVAGFSKAEENEKEDNEEGGEKGREQSPTLYELEEEVDRGIILDPQREKFMKEKKKEKRKLLGERVEEENFTTKKVKNAKTFSYLPQNYVENQKKKREESNLRHERNQTRRKANKLLKKK